MVRGMRYSLMSAALAIAACGGAKPVSPAMVPPTSEPVAKHASATAPTQAIEPAERPDSVLVELSVNQRVLVPKLDAFLQEAGETTPLARKTIDDLTASLFDVQMRGIVENSSLRALILDPKIADPPGILVVEVADAEALLNSLSGSTIEVRQAGTFAAIGKPASLNAAANYALWRSAGSETAEATATLFVPSVVRVYAEQIKTLQRLGPMAFGSRGPDGVRRAATFLAEARSLLDQCDTVVLSLDAVADSITLELQIAALADTSFAAFVQSQQPATYALLSSLPAKNWWAAAGGHIKMSSALVGILRDVALLSNFKRRTQQKPLIVLRHLSTALAPVSRDLVWAASSSTSAGLIAEISVPSAVPALFDEFTKHTKADWTNPDYTLKVGRRPFRHRKAAFREMIFKPTSSTEHKHAVYFGALGPRVVGVTVAGKNPRRQAKSLIDELSGSHRATSSVRTTTIIAASKARAESFLAWVDFHAMLKALGLGVGKVDSRALEIGIGFAGKNARARLTIPAELVHTMMTLGAGVTPQ